MKIREIITPINLYEASGAPRPPRRPPVNANSSYIDDLLNKAFGSLIAKIKPSSDTKAHWKKSKKTAGQLYKIAAFSSLVGPWIQYCNQMEKHEKEFKDDPNELARLQQLELGNFYTREAALLTELTGFLTVDLLIALFSKFPIFGGPIGFVLKLLSKPIQMYILYFLNTDEGRLWLAKLISVETIEATPAVVQGIWDTFKDLVKSGVGYAEEHLGIDIPGIGPDANAQTTPATDTQQTAQTTQQPSTNASAQTTPAANTQQAAQTTPQPSTNASAQTTPAANTQQAAQTTPTNATTSNDSKSKVYTPAGMRRDAQGNLRLQYDTDD